MTRRSTDPLLLGLLLAPAAHAGPIDPACAGLPKPDDYDERAQQDFLANTMALVSTASPVHGPLPHDPGRGSLGVVLHGIPTLSCERRYVLDWTKTEDTNKSPILPRLRASYAFPLLAERVRIYAGGSWLPPVNIGGTRNVSFGVELGVGGAVGPVQIAARGHASMLRTVGEIATPFDEGDPVVDDLFLATTMGVDLSIGYAHTTPGALTSITPYLAGGFVDASTFFWIGDDDVVTNNLHPYAGFAFSAGVDLLIVDQLRLAVEFYGAPGGHARVDPSLDPVAPASRYGHLYTGRAAIAWEPPPRARRSKAGRGGTGE